MGTVMSAVSSSGVGAPWATDVLCCTASSVKSSTPPPSPVCPVTSNPERSASGASRFHGPKSYRQVCPAMLPAGQAGSILVAVPFGLVEVTGAVTVKRPG